MNKTKSVILFLLILLVSIPIMAEDCGDVNSDGTSNIVDALLIAQAYVGIGDIEKTKADVNGDGEANIVDALLIAQYYVGIISELSGCEKGKTSPEDGTDGGGNDSDEVIGWATTGDGITGGGDASPVTVTSMKALSSAAKGSNPKVIYVKGHLKGKLSVGSNKTIIGLAGAKVTSGGASLSIAGSQNVIIKNIHFQGQPDGGADMANIRNSRNVWLDHCNFVDGGDGMLDIVGSSDLITVSWSKFWYTKQTDHQNAILLASSNGSKESRGHMNITFHHNYFSKNMTERIPRVRFGKVHIFNNLYEATKDWTYYAIRCGYEANVRSENNIFKDFKGKSKGYRNGEMLVFNYFDGSKNSVLESIGDVFINCTESAIDVNGVRGGTFGNGTAFTPPYEYSLDATTSLEAAIKAGAGAK